MEVFGGKFGDKKEQAAWRRFGPPDMSWSAFGSCETPVTSNKRQSAGNQS